MVTTRLTGTLPCPIDTKTGAAPHCAAPPRISTLESPVSLRGRWTTAIQCLDPPRRLSFNGPFRCSCRRTLASALALPVEGLGRAVGGSKPCYLFCVHWTRLPLPVALWVATAFAYSACSPHAPSYSVVFPFSADGIFLPADGTYPTSRARRSASSRLECTPSNS